jgi:hypothetical protein
VILPLFKCHRATVRGKVESLLLDDPSVGRRQKATARRRARAYFALAESYTRPPTARAVVLVTGPSGAGKSVLAGTLAARLGAVLLSTDLARRVMFAEGGRRASLNEGIYSRELRESIYQELQRQAVEALGAGRSVVLDGTYIERRQRLPVEELAQKYPARLLVIECTAPDEVVRLRQVRRESEPWSASEGRWEVYLEQKARFEPASEVPESSRVTVDTTQTLAMQVETILTKLKAQPARFTRRRSRGKEA